MTDEVTGNRTLSDRRFTWAAAGSQPSAGGAVNSHLVFRVEHHGLSVRHSHHVVVEGGGRQPYAGRQLVVKQRQLGDQTLRLLLFGGQCGETLPDAHQRLDELPLRGQAHRLQARHTQSEGEGLTALPVTADQLRAREREREVKV